LPVFPPLFALRNSRRPCFSHPTGKRGPLCGPKRKLRPNRSRIEADSYAHVVRTAPMDTEVHPELINGRFAYVSISRASHDAQVFTNDAANLAERMSKDVSKTSALDFAKPQVPLPGAALDHPRAMRAARGTGLGLGL
jgi:hypothetical protein